MPVGRRTTLLGLALGLAGVVAGMAVLAPSILENRAQAANREVPQSPFDDGQPADEGDAPAEAEGEVHGTPARPAAATPAAAGAGAEAETEAEEPEALDDASGDAPGAALHALACLEGEGGNDRDGARRGVQKRDFIKRHRFEVSLLGGHYAADLLSSTYTYGAALDYWLSEDFALEALVARNPVQFRLEQPFTGFDREHHFQSGVAWNAMGGMVWAPIHAKLRWSERRITHADLSWTAGAGRTFSDTAQGLTLQVGLGLRLFLARFLSIRLDVRDLVIAEEVLGRGRTTHNIVTLLGLCGWFPG